MCIRDRCTLCALTAMIQMALGENDAKGSMRMIGGLLMLHLTLDGARDLWAVSYTHLQRDDAPV